ncbi:MAG: hypothetical protein NTU98_12230 [Bacteroidetes bacterium]|nr:hypothetical protein [Bacteroidota bacterium]
MARKKTKKNKNTPASQVKNKKNTPDLFFLTDRFFEKHEKKIFWIGLGLTLFLGALLFDLRISDSSDDSDYILAALDFIRGKSFPAWHGSFYPLFLCLPVLIFGANLFVLKFISFLLMAGHFVVLFQTFKSRVRPTILVIVTLLTAISSYILYFSSSTFSEALYFFLQALAVFYFFKIIDNLNPEPDERFPDKKLWIVFGLLAFLLSITRNVGLGIVIAFILYFLLNRQYKATLYGIGSFLIFQIPYSLYQKIFWKIPGFSFGGQLGVMIQKDAYNPALGNEDVAGFVIRFLKNSELYFSKHLPKFLGLRAFDSDQTSFILTVVIFILFLTGLIVAFRRKNRYMQFIALYLAVAISITFLTQQVRWDQGRLILVYIPLLIILILYGLSEISKHRYLKIIPVFVLGIFIISFFSTFYRTADKARQNWPVLKAQATGHKYAGFTPDWVHYFQASEWAAKNLPADAVIGCRKASMSFIYSNGRDFFGINKIPVVEKDSMISSFERRNADVIILENFELGDKKFPAEYLDRMRVFSKALFISEVPQIFTIVEPAPALRTKMLNSLTIYNINIHTDLARFRTMIDDPEMNFYAVDPDQLVKKLKDSNVRYLIMGNLRFNSNVNDGRIISTIQKYVYCVSWKYPNMFRRIYQAGGDGEEPAEVLEITYPN